MTLPASAAARPSTSVPLPSTQTEIASVGLSYGAKPMKSEFTLPSSTSAVPVLPATRVPETWARMPEPLSTQASMASLVRAAASALTAWPSDLGLVAETVVPSAESTWSTT